MTLRLSTLPLSTNALYRNNGPFRHLTEKAKRNKEAMAWEMRAGYRGAPLTGPLAVEITLYWPDRRKHDVDNVKGLLDSGTGILWEDDGQIVDLHTMKEVDPKNPRVEMHVWPQ